MPTLAEGAQEHVSEPSGTVTCPIPGHIHPQPSGAAEADLGSSPSSAWTTLFTSLTPTVFIKIWEDVGYLAVSLKMKHKGAWSYKLQAECTGCLTPGHPHVGRHIQTPVTFTPTAFHL